MANLSDVVPDRLFNAWTDEENREFRKRSIIRACLNQEQFFSIGKGIYYDWANGNDMDKLGIIQLRNKKVFRGRQTAYNKRLEQKGIIGQVRITFDDEDNFVDFKEEGAE